MGKKAKVGKSRKDHFYALAKKQGFRARSSFKLSQLAQKYGLFESCLYVIDLCAAPGGWMQVASQELPVAGHVFGVDLVPISPLPKCTSIQADITTERCEKLLRREMNVVGVPDLKVDLVLHDGAPNVGADWRKDAYVQNELVLKALHLAVKFLKPSGTFVTKVFRSQDYTKLLYVFQQLFQKVQATKPQASRNVSAEIFVVCHKYLAPKKISPDLFDLNKVFAHVEDDQNKSLGTIAREALQTVDEKAQINQGGLSAALRLTKKKRREGYDVGDDYRVCTAKQFFESANAAQVLVVHNKIEFKDNDDFDMAVKTHKSTTEEILEFCDDLKVLGKPALEKLLKWRKKILTERLEAKHALETKSDAAQAKEEDAKSDSEIQKELDQQLDTLLQKEAKQKLKIVRKQRAKLRKLEMKRKIAEAVFQPESHDPELFSKEGAEVLEEEDKLVDATEGWDDEPAYDGLHVYTGDNEQVEEKEIEAPDSDTDYVDLLEKELAKLHEEEKELAILKGLKGKEKRKRETRREQKLKEWAAEMEEVVDDIEARNLAAHEKNAESSDDDDSEVDQDRLNESTDVPSDEEEEGVQEVDRDDEEASLDYDQMEASNSPPEMKKAHDEEAERKAKLFFSDEMFLGLRDLKIDGKIVQKVEKSKKKDDEESDSGNDDDIPELADNEVPKIPLSESQQKKLKRKAAALRLEQKEKKKAKREAELLSGLGSLPEDSSTLTSAKSAKQHVIHQVPREEIVIEKPQHKEDLAEIQAIGSLMVRKKSRMDLMDGLYNRWAFEDSEELPEWFKEDDERARIPDIPVTKELMDEYRRKLREIAERPIRKVAEAKARKKARLEKRMAAIRAQAAHIAESSDLSEKAKAQSIDKLMKKARKGDKKDKTYVVARKGGGSKEIGPRSKRSGSKKLIDRRLKADKRGMRAAMRRNKHRRR